MNDAGQRPQPGAVFHDGQGRRHVVTLAFGAGLRILEGGIPLAEWPWRDIRFIEGAGDRLRLCAIGAPQTVRLEILDPALRREVVTRCDALQRAPRTGQGAWVRPAVLSGAALASVAALLWFGIPYAAARLAPLIPSSWERRLGEAADAQVRTTFKGRTCSRPDGVAALAKLTDRLSATADLPFVIRPQVIASSIPNAFALPGGRVYVLNGLLARADSPDELGGVLAHELGHVRHRDHLRRLIANGGTAYVVGMLFGDVAGAGALIVATRTLLGAAYSRDAETGADSFAAQTMGRLGRPTKPLGDLLLRIETPGSEGGFTLIHDHPLSADRAKALESANAGASGPPLLTPEEWRALKRICD